MNLTRNIASFVGASLVAFAIATPAVAQIHWTKSVGNRNAGADATFRVVSSISPGMFETARHTASGTLRADGDLLRDHFEILDIGAKGYVAQSVFAPVPSSSCSAWISIGGNEIASDSGSSSASLSQRIPVPIAGFSRNYGVGPFTIRVRAGADVVVTPSFGATANPSTWRATASAGLDVGVEASGSGTLSAGDAVGIKIISKVTLIEVGGDLVSAVSAAGRSAYLDLHATAITIRLVLKAWALDLIEYKETLIDETLGSWRKRLTF